MTDGPELTPDDVKEILRLIDESRFDEFELETPRFSVRLNRGGGPGSPAAALSAESPPSLDGATDLVEVASPAVGTVYQAPAPGEPPFVEVGSSVTETTQLCLIEVMKLMNAVEAGVRGTIVEVCVENGAPVQYGDVLFRIRPDA
jgi:biotin carboxyl carrier protein